MAQLNYTAGQSSLKVAKTHRDQMIGIAQSELPLESCGILAGDGIRSRQVIQITNVLKSPVRYELSPAELVKAFWSMEESGLSILSFFHSHPNTPPHPSRTDVESHLYPEIPQIILGSVGGKWELRAYYLLKAGIKEVPILFS